MDDFDVSNIAQDIINAVKKEYQSMEHLNILILGKTGVGKSTLINSAFHEELAKTGVGKPVTEHIRPLSKRDFPLTIYDTPGLELSGSHTAEKLLAEVKTLVKKGIHSGSVSEAIHCIWYCISTPTHRIEQAEIDFLKGLCTDSYTRDVPIVIVLTQSYSTSDARALMREIEKERLPIDKIIPVLAKIYVIDGMVIKRPYGLEELMNAMDEIIPEAVRTTFTSVEKANLGLKKKAAHSAVLRAASRAATIGAVPIPVADATLLIPNQVAMIAKITSIFGISMPKGTIMAVLSGLLGTSGATIGGRTIVTSLLKLIPGAGSVVGGAISAATAAALTAALGEAYIIIMAGIASGELPADYLSSPEGKKKISEIFKQRLSLKRNKDGIVEP